MRGACISLHCHSRRAAHGAAREGNLCGNAMSTFDKWFPFPSHGYRHARPGMTDEGRAT